MPSRWLESSGVWTTTAYNKMGRGLTCCWRWCPAYGMCRVEARAALATMIRMYAAARLPFSPPRSLPQLHFCTRSAASATATAQLRGSAVHALTHSGATASRGCSSCVYAHDACLNSSSTRMRYGSSQRSALVPCALRAPSRSAPVGRCRASRACHAWLDAPRLAFTLPAKSIRHLYPCLVPLGTMMPTRLYQHQRATRRRPLGLGDRWHTAHMGGAPPYW